MVAIQVNAIRCDAFGILALLPLASELSRLNKLAVGKGITNLGRSPRWSHLDRLGEIVEPSGRPAGLHEAVELLLKRGADVNQDAIVETTALHAVAMGGQPRAKVIRMRMKGRLRS